MRHDFRRVAPAVIAAMTAAMFNVAVQAADMRAAGVSPSLIARGDQQWAAGNLDAAQKTFEQAAQADPQSVDAQMKLAGLQLARNDFGGSIETYQRAIGLDPKNVRAWMGLGIAYRHTGRNELSRAAFDEAVRIEPGRKEQLAPVMTGFDMSD